MKLENTLQKFGLTRREALLYLATLELGSASVQKIAVKSGLVRSTAYEVLERLREKNLVTTYLKKKIRWYSAEDPNQIVGFAESRVNVLKSALPELNALAGKTRRRPSIRFYEGKNEIEIIFDEILNEADTLLGLSSSDDLFRELSSVHKQFLERRISKKIPLRVILRDTPHARARQAAGKNELREVKLLPNTSEFHGLIYIWKNKIAQFSIAGDFVASVTESAEVANMQRAWFEALWERLV
ncbi:MAG: helix-turn-helix domain-containing protein [Candidatus Magasanikbacteria bacterium]|nr:helix-turn-helix domain-containing protein [Candidatus Magasanikbacteria bacterium]